MISTRRGYSSVFRLLIFLCLVTLLLAFWGNRVRPVAQPLFHHGNQWLETWRFRHADFLQNGGVTVYHPRELKPQAALIATEAERVLRFFEKHHHFQIQKPVPIFLFPDRESLRRHFSWPENQSATGVYFSGAIYLLNPEVWDPGFPSARHRPEDWIERFHLKGPLYHEMAHFYLDRVTGGNFPRWYTEAYAQWVEYRQIGFEWVIPSNRLENQTLYTYEELDRRFDQLPNQALAYRQSFLFLRYMIRTSGEGSLDRLHDMLADGLPFASAWKRVFGQPPEESFRKWENEAAEK